MGTSLTENHFDSDSRRVKMANSRDPRMDNMYLLSLCIAEQTII